MKINTVIAKLRMQNIKNYYLLLFCTVLSVMLVTSYALMYNSPTVQNILPAGGDSRKQANIIFIIALIGCAVFTTYASSLFFRYKSKEFGIFMALGMKKKDLKYILVKELSIMIPISSLLGLIISLPISFGIWKIFQLVIIDTKEMIYQIGGSGFLYGIAFCIFVIACIFTAGAKFIKRSNIMEIIYEQQKSEPIRELKPWVGTVGWLLSLGGITLGYIVPQLSNRFF